MYSHGRITLPVLSKGGISTSRKNMHCLKLCRKNQQTLPVQMDKPLSVSCRFSSSSFDSSFCSIVKQSRTSVCSLISMKLVQNYYFVCSECNVLGINRRLIFTCYSNHQFFKRSNLSFL